MVLLHLIRHGQSTFNAAADVCREWTKVSRDVSHHDAPLTDLGMQQASAIVAPEVDAVVVSPLTRALQTASIAFPLVTPQFIVMAECRESLHATCDIGRSPSLLKKEFPDICFESLPEEWWAMPGRPAQASVQRWAEKPDPEQDSDTNERLRSALRKIVALGLRRVAVVAHYGAIQHFMSANFSTDTDQCRLANCDVLTVEVDVDTLKVMGDISIWKNPLSTLVTYKIT